MKSQELINLGVPKELLPVAIQTIKRFFEEKKLNLWIHNLNPSSLPGLFEELCREPNKGLGDLVFGELAEELLKYKKEREKYARFREIPYKVWGKDIERGAFKQMELACSVPVAKKAALMPDAHLGYGLPIGGVLALDNAVSPHAVGVDIACRMKLSIFPSSFYKNLSEVHKDKKLKKILLDNTKFGLDIHKEKQEHPILDEDWEITPHIAQLKDVGRKQLGSSGGGNHFVEFGIVEIDGEEFLSLLSHSGSRRVGYQICRRYSKIAEEKLPSFITHFKGLAWLSLDSEEGAEYWAAMNLMGEYARANHDIIHNRISKALEIDPVRTIDNHHNFAWKEEVDGETLIVHRKGATPAQRGIEGIIPGSMGTPAYLVRGKGNVFSLNSASHGAGRRMSRTEGQRLFNFDEEREKLYSKGIKILSAGADECPGVYKDINKVMEEQTDLVEVIGKFYPKLVRMCKDEGYRRKKRKRKKGERT